MEVTPIGLGVDTLLYENTVAREVYKTDIAIIENNPGLVYEDIQAFRRQGKLKLYGGGWGAFPEGVGHLSREEVGSAIMSAGKVEVYNPYTGVREIIDWLAGQPTNAYIDLLAKVLS